MAITNKDLEITIKFNYKGLGINTATEDLKKFVNAVNSSGNKVNSSSSGISSGMSSIISSLKNVGGHFINTFTNIATKAINGVINMLPSLRTLLLGLGAGVVMGVKSFIGLNSEFEKMRVTMDVMSQGHGEEWFHKLREFALKAPIDIESVTGAFRTLTTYGLTPTMSLMKSLVGVSSVLPEGGKAIEGIARALGQVQSKGRLEGQEMRQLAEWGVPAYAIAHKLMADLASKTGQDVTKMKYTMIDAKTFLGGIQEAMENKFGLASDRIAKTWLGMTAILKNYTKEFFAEIGESGTMAPFEDKLKGIIDSLDKSFKSGEFQKAAKLIGSTFNIIFTDFTDSLNSGKKSIIDWASLFVDALINVVKVVDFLKRAFLGIKLVFLIIKEAFLANVLIIVAGLYGIIFVIDEVVAGWVNMVNMIPDSVPGVKIFKAALGSVSSVVSTVKDTVGDMVIATANGVATTGEAIVKTVGDIADSAKKSDALVAKLKENQKILINTPNVPPKPSNVGEGPLGSAGGESPLPGHEVKDRSGDKAYWTDLATQVFNVASMTDKIKIGFLQWFNAIEKNPLKRLAKDIKAWIDALKSGISSAYADIIKGNMNLQQGFNAVTKVMREAFIKSLADMLAEETIIQGARLLLHETTEATKTEVTAVGETERLSIQVKASLKSIAISVATGIKRITIAAYHAAAEAYTSLALIPFVGPTLAFAAAATTFALIIGYVAKIASFEKGTGLAGIPSTGPAIVHKGEIIMTKKESDIFRNMMQNGGSSESSVNLNFNISAMDGDSVESVVRKKIIPMLRNNARDFGKMRTIIKENA